MLSYSQVDRILRPLRNKCNALAAHISKPGDGPSSVPPLSVPHPPDNIGVRVYFDKHHVNTLELSRKQYAVRDCFKDVLAKILAGNNAQNISQRRVVGLADLCAIIVGSQLYTELNQTPDDDEEEEDPAIELLETIPLQYRKKAVVAHSLELVLQLCPHQPSLLLLLLDVTLAYHLENESYALLHALFTAACKSDASSSPPICHPSSQTFLVDLCKNWALSGLTVDGFVRVLMDVLRTVDSARIWTSKAMMAFMPESARDSMPPFMTCICELLGALPDISTTDIEKSSEFCHFLQRMLDIASEHLLSQDHHLETDWIIILLDYMNNLVELANRPNMEDISLATTNTLICFATHWLWRPPAGMSDQLRRVKLLLGTIKPKPTTYDMLLCRITASGDLHDLKQSIQSYTSVLRSHGLLRHEASLWACALRQIDVPAVEQVLSIRSGAQPLKKFRLTLIELVEEAEKRCFGRQSPPPPGHHTNGYSRRRKRTSSGSGTWTWDPTFGCWLRPPSDRPFLKKQKTRLNDSYPTRFSCPAPINVCEARRHSLCSPSRESSPECESDYPPPGLDHPSQGITNFATLLCRAISNRTVLHPEKDHPTCDDKTRTCSSPDWISRLDESDDKLDLFLCE